MDLTLAAADRALKEGRKHEAAELLKSALTGRSAPARLHVLLLNLLLELRQYAEGVRWSEKAAHQIPRDYDILNLRGAFLRLTDHRQEALAIFDQAIKLRPGEIAARANKGHVFNDLGNGAAAEKIFAALVRQHPRIAELQRALGVALVHQGRFDKADQRFRQAAAIDPKSPDAWLDLSANAVRQNHITAALTALDSGLSATRGNPRLIRARVTILLRSGQSDQAISYLRSIQSDHANAPWFHHDLARCLTHNQPEAAAEHHRRAIAGEPANREYRLAYVEHLLRNASGPEGSHIDAAHAALMACPPIQGMKAAEVRIRAQLLARAVDFEGVSALGSFSQLGRLWAEAGLHTALLDHLARVASPEDRRELVDQHRIWGDAAIRRASLNPVRRNGGTRSPSRIRIGFMSSDLREHPVTYFAWPLFEHADHERFEIFCYSFYRGSAESPMQRKLTAMVDEFRWRPAITDRDAAQMIADDDLDILFELGGSTFMNKLEVMAWKPARICASWLGYPHSSGLATIDYLLVDPYLNPPDPALLIEAPLVMPRSWITMSELAFPDSYRINPAAPALRNGFITFGTANNTYKYTPAMFRAWAQVMARVPNSRFIFVRPEVGANIVATNIRARFEAEGIAADRIEFRAVRGTHMLHYNDIDIALDTFPQSGGTTTCEALWMGVPTVTLAGEAVFERLSLSILTNAGLGDLCATSPEAFVDIAVALAADTDRIQALRTGLREQIRASPLGQTRQFAEDFYDLVARTVGRQVDRDPLALIASTRYLPSVPETEIPPKLAIANSAFAAGRVKDAIALIISALQENPALPVKVYRVLIANLIGLDFLDEGLAWTHQALARNPEDVELHNFKGVILRMKGQAAEALPCFEHVLSIDRGHRSALTNKALILIQQGDASAAEAILRPLLADEPASPELHRALGKALWAQGRLDEAAASLREAVRLQPAHIDAWLDLSALIVDIGAPEDALAMLDQAIAIAGTDGRLCEAKAIMLRRAGLPDQVGPWLKSLAGSHSGSAWYQYELGRYKALSDRHAANVHLRRAVELEPANSDYRSGLAESLLKTRGGDEGACLDEAWQLIAALPLAARRNVARIAVEIALAAGDVDAPAAFGSFETLGRRWATTDQHTALLYQMARVDGPAARLELIHQHRLWGAKAAERAARHPIVKAGTRGGGPKIRIGFMSSDLREHVVTHFIWPLLEHADRDRFEIHCYSWFRGEEPSPLQTSIASMVDVFRWHPFISDRDAAQMIADDDLDILFELGGSTHMNKIDVMAWKPARLCASWLGYPHSAGLSTIDYLLVDPYLNPPDPALLIEQPLIMPRTWIAMSPQAFPDTHIIDPVAPVRRNGHVTFGTANNPYKYNSAMLRAWAAVLLRTPDARLLFVRPEAGSDIFRQHIRARFAGEGVAEDRILFRAVRGAHMTHYNDIDIALDTFPQTGGTTTCEALWMGVPTVTMVGEALFERMGYSILTNTGLGDLCALSPEAFGDIAVALAADTDRIQALRTGLRDQIRTSPLGQTEQFARDFYDLVARTVAAGTETPLPQTFPLP